MATEMFFKADVQPKFTQITDSSGRDFGVMKAQKLILILGMQHVLIHVEQLHKDAIFPYQQSQLYATVHKNKNS